MRDYVSKALYRLQHTKRKRPQYALHRWSVPAYEKRLQMAPYPGESNLLDKKITKRIQSIVRTILYYARLVYPTMLRAINAILRLQSQPTRDTKEKARMLLDYEATYPNSTLSYKVSNMVLHVDSDAENLTMSEARSCYVGYFYLSDWPSPSPINPNYERNFTIHTWCKTIRNVVSSAAYAETCVTLNNRETAIDMQPALIALYHRQPATPLRTYNYTTEGF